MPKRSYSRADKIHALKVIELCEGNLSAASRELQIPRKTLATWVADNARSGEAELANHAPIGKPLANLKHERFVTERVSGKSATDAAACAGYEGNRDVLASTGNRLLRNEKIRARIRQRVFSAASLTEDEVIGTLTEQMRGDVDDMLNESGFVSLDLARQNQCTHLIKKLKYGEFGLSEVEFHSPQAAAAQLSKILGIEQQPKENDADKRKRVTVKMLRTLIDHGATKEQAKANLLNMAVSESDVDAALAQIEAHEKQVV